jgi:hypothetical protein
MGTVGAAASTGASAGSGSSSTMNTVSSVVSGASSIIGSIVGAVYEIRGMREQRETVATGSNIASAQVAEENRYRQQAQQAAAEELAAQNAADSVTSAALHSREQEIALENARARRALAQQEIESRIGGQFSRSRSFPSWAWWGIGIGGVGLTFLIIWLVARKK